MKKIVLKEAETISNSFLIFLGFFNLNFLVLSFPEFILRGFIFCQSSYVSEDLKTMVVLSTFSCFPPILKDYKLEGNRAAHFEESAM